VHDAARVEGRRLQRVEKDCLRVQPANPQMSDKMVPRGGIEPPTLRFSVACSENPTRKFDVGIRFSPANAMYNRHQSARHIQREKFFALPISKASSP
jgi:hypothetical protein